MKAALIPPRGYEATIQGSHFQLMLAQVQHDEYLQAYRQAETRGDYIVMDNGAAEEQTVPFEEVLRHSIYCDVDEVVLPDVFFEMHETLDAVDSALDEVSGEDLGFKYMAVVQGQSLSNVEEILGHYSDLQPKGIHVLGIPRHWIQTISNEYARFKICQYIQDMKLVDKFEVHLLGTNPRWPGEVRKIRDEFPWIRSVDTSMPYNYTIEGLHMPSSDSFVAEGDAWVSRPEKYFEQEPKMNEQFLYTNINRYMRWASGSEGTWGELL